MRSCSCCVDWFVNTYTRNHYSLIHWPPTRFSLLAVRAYTGCPLPPLMMKVALMTHGLVSTEAYMRTLDMELNQKLSKSTLRRRLRWCLRWGTYMRENTYARNWGLNKGRAFAQRGCIHMQEVNKRERAFARRGCIYRSLGYKDLIKLQSHKLKRKCNSNV